jgi:hypothetical protein
MEAKYGTPIVSGDKHFQQLSSLTFSWSNSKNTGKLLYGGFQINGFTSCFTSLSVFWQPDGQGCTDKEKEFYSKLNWFHKSAYGSDGAYGCFYREHGVYPCPVYFYDLGETFLMNMNLGEYYEKMLENKAVALWEYFYIDPKEIITKYKYLDCSLWNHLHMNLGNKSRAEGVLVHMNYIIDLFPGLFPDFDLSFLKAKRDLYKQTLENSLKDTVNTNELVEIINRILTDWKREERALLGEANSISYSVGESIVTLDRSLNNRLRKEIQRRVNSDVSGSSEG